MKKAILMITFAAFTFGINAQVFTTNTTPVGLEHNVLFSATTRFSVTQTGSAALTLGTLFDGKFAPSYTATGPSADDPTVILIEDLPNSPTQTGAWVGWSTRYWQAKRFKVEAFDAYKSKNTWKVISDYSDQDYNGGRSYSAKLPSGTFTKLRFTFYSAVGTDGRLGVSELFYIHPEAVRPYEGLLDNSNGTMNYKNGNVGIGTTDPGAWRLAVNGKIRAKEVKVETDWADFVFEEKYELPTLAEVEDHIKEKGHLKDIPSAGEVAENGILLGEINAKLLQKIEELTLYTIDQQKEIETLNAQGIDQQKEIETLKTLVEKLIEDKK